MYTGYKDAVKETKPSAQESIAARNTRRGSMVDGVVVGMEVMVRTRLAEETGTKKQTAMKPADTSHTD